MPASQAGARDRASRSCESASCTILEAERVSPLLRRCVIDWKQAHPDIACRNASDPVSMAHMLHEAAEQGVDAVAISGGDGTVDAVVNTVFAHNPFPRLPVLALSRGVTTNMTARDLGMSGRQDRALRSLIDRASRGGNGLTMTGRPAMRIDLGAGREALDGMFFGAAAIAQGIEHHMREMHTRGLRGERHGGHAGPLRHCDGPRRARHRRPGADHRGHRR
jgi:hypothetical protein